MPKKKKKNGTPKVDQSAPMTPSRIPEDTDKVRTLSIECYCKPERFQPLLDASRHFAWILHDKDTKPDGTQKTPHYHILVNFENPRYVRAIKGLINLDGLTTDTTVLCEKIISPKGAFDYLTHNTPQAQRDGKFLYSPTDVNTDDSGFWRSQSEDKSKDNDTFLLDLEKLSPRDLALKYGRDYIRNYQRYSLFRDVLLFEEEKQRSYETLQTLFDALLEHGSPNIAEEGRKIDILEACGVALAYLVDQQNRWYNTPERIAIRNVISDVTMSLERHYDKLTDPSRRINK